MSAGVIETGVSGLVWPYYAWTWSLPEYASKTPFESGRVRTESDLPPGIEARLRMAKEANDAGEARKAQELLSGACSSVNWTACMILGGLEMNGGKDIAPNPEAAGRHIAIAIPFLKANCDAGDTDMCFALAGLYNEGVGVTKDAVKAKSLFQMLCSKSRDVDSDASCAFASCIGGTTPEHGESCAIVGAIMLQDERLPARLIAKAVGRFAEGCALNSKRACKLLGMCYLTGSHIDKNTEKATEHFRKACLLGDTPSCDLAESSTKVQQ